jgi:hypothetical protein
MANSLDHLTNRMKLEWTSQLNTEYVPAKNYRRTSIICTIGESFLLIDAPPGEPALKAPSALLLSPKPLVL